MIEYATRQIFYDAQPNLLEKIRFDCDIKLSFREDPSNLNWVGKDGHSFGMLQHFPDAKEIAFYKKHSKNAFELTILSKDDLLAENTNSLIYSGRLLCYPQIDFKEYSLLSINDSDALIQSG